MDSTNLLARELASDGATHGTLVIADEQTGGMGRKGRGWASPAGLNLYISIILRPTELPDLKKSPGLIPLCAGLAVARALNTEDGINVSLKWPNDILHDEKKLGGILMEARTPAAPAEGFAVLGIGINVNSLVDDFPPELKDIATSLSIMTGREHDREELLQAIIKSMQREFDDLSVDGGDIQMLKEYENVCSTIGKDVRAILHDSMIEGAAIKLDSMGRLIIKSDQGEQTLSSADIIHLR